MAPSLNVENNVSGLSAVANFIISHNKECEYEHFLQGKSDGEKGTVKRIMRIWRNYGAWKKLMNENEDENENGNGNEDENGNGNSKAVIHYNFPLDAPSILRDFFFMRAAHKRKKRMVIHLHGGLYLFKEKKPFIIRQFLKRIFKWDCPFIVLSNKEKEQIQKEYHTENISVLPNCVDLSVAESYTKVIVSHHLDILYLGRIEPNKGMDFLYDALEQWKEEYDDFTLHFAGIEQGGNGYIGKYQQLLGERFVYEGVVAGEKKNELFRKCQIFILPSLYEGLPMSLLETMSYGLVPIVTNVGSIGEYVKDQENGLLIKTSDTESIIKALKCLSQDTDLLQKLSKAARQTILMHFSPQEYVSKLNQIYSYVNVNENQNENENENHKGKG